MIVESGSIPGKKSGFTLLHSVVNVSGAHPASYPIGIVGSFLEGKAAGEGSRRLVSV
jgi:hypothetical protein